MNLGSVHDTPPGDYVIAGPDEYNVPIPAGTQRIDVDYNRIWIIGSTRLKGSSDLTNVNLIQDNYTLTPLSQYGTNYRPKNVTNPTTTVQNYPLPTGLNSTICSDNSPAVPTAGSRPARTSKVRGGWDRTRHGTLAERAPEAKILSGVLKTPWPPALRRSGTTPRPCFLRSFDSAQRLFPGRLWAVRNQLPAACGRNSGWPWCRYLRPDDFCHGWADHNKEPLNGSTSYVVHMASAPPVTEGWSLTVYNLKGALIPNPINRFAISDTSQLAHNAEGSVDIYLQATQPSDPAGRQLAADRERTGIRDYLAAPGSPAGRDPRHPQWHGLAATGQSPRVSGAGQ